MRRRGGSRLLRVVKIISPAYLALCMRMRPARTFVYIRDHNREVGGMTAILLGLARCAPRVAKSLNPEETERRRGWRGGKRLRENFTRCGSSRTDVVVSEAKRRNVRLSRAIKINRFTRGDSGGTEISDAIFSPEGESLKKR